ncbi:putative amidohydrolase YtcJ [Hydrogenophaga palleronii]|uniref:Amidohydrolase YtcJ n=1 Tax=Hydrogenophaga palleronii TaxID=65655 RepID=A0ABU1WKE4_9BURK|nr:amidohydrolase [Hydrogenophaga palleronii]MDR7149751.1 putative amidohydrolase YtcJ [Hydrogenophaga palleronii]
MNETIFHHARICTMAPERPWAEAISVRDGRIVAVGTLEEARAALPGAPVVALPGEMVVPGLLDVHNHFVWAGRAELYEMFVPPILSLDQVLDAVRETASKKAPGEWIVGGMLGSSLIGQVDRSTRLRLDEAAGGRPVMLRDDSQHNRFVSTAALAAAGIDHDTPDPLNGTIVRDPATGEASGLLVEAACGLVELALARALAATPHLDVEAAAHAVKRLNAFGVTAMQEALSSRAVLRAVKTLDDEGRLSAWVVGSIPVTEAPLAPGEIPEELLAMREDFRTRHFMPDAGKIFLDGVPTSRTAAMLEPYLPDAIHGCCFRGGTTLTVPQLAKVLAEAETNGIRVKIHCTGDASTRAALDAIDVLRSFNGPGLRHQIAHASFIDPAEIPRFAELNVVADLSPPLWYPSVIVEAIRTTLPQTLVDRLAPIRSLVEAGALIAGGSDWPVVPDPSPWPGIQGMVTRRDPTGRMEGALCPEQAIGVADALKAYTINAAQAIGLGHLTGSIEVGKSADLAVLNARLFDVDPADIGKTQVLQTWFEGRCVHEANS